VPYVGSTAYAAVIAAASFSANGLTIAWSLVFSAARGEVSAAVAAVSAAPGLAAVPLATSTPAVTSRTTQPFGWNGSVLTILTKDLRCGSASVSPPPLRRLEKALDFAHVLGDAAAETFTLGNLGTTLIHAERWDEAQDAFERALLLAESLGDRERKATALAGLGGIAMHQGRKAKAARLYRRAAALCGTEDRRHLAEHLVGLVEALSALGREQELERELQRLVDLVQQSGDEEVAVDGLTRAAWWQIERGKREEAAYFYATAIAIAAVSSLLPEEHRTDEAFVKALRDALISQARISSALAKRSNVRRPILSTLSLLTRPTSRPRSLARSSNRFLRMR
jgi:Tetratricopeptide repeat